MKHFLFLLFLIPALAFAEAMYSPTWGFKIDLPEGYEYSGGDGRDRFSFESPGGALFDIAVYNGVYSSMKEMIDDVNRRIENRGGTDFFNYRDKQAAIIELDFGGCAGWGFCVELAGTSAGKRPMFLALSYGPADMSELNLFYLSALDSIAPSDEDCYYPGPITEYSYPRGGLKKVSLAAGGISAMVYENDAEAAQVLIEREFYILRNYLSSSNWKEAWIRYYRFIFRDSYDRITNAASAIVKNWGVNANADADAKRAFARKALEFVQSFKYERNLDGSDFINLVSAVTDGRGDCDSRAMLWAIILSHAGIRAAIMVSGEYGHAMGMADIPGTGARFETHGIKWLVAETSANVDIGLIAENVSDPQSWLGVVFE